MVGVPPIVVCAGRRLRPALTSLFSAARIALGLLWGWGAAAQAPAPAPRDPLMSLLMTQPRTDIPANVTAVAEFDPPAVRPGELAVYRVAFNALEESITWPEKVPAPAGINLRAGGHGQVMQFGGGGYVPRTCFDYHLRVARAGEVVLPSFVVQVGGKPVTVPSARLVVTPSPPAGTAPATQIILELPVTNLFVGQTVRARVMLPSNPAGQIQVLAQVQVNGDGLLVDAGTARQQISPVARAGRMVTAFVYETTLTPLKAGKLTVLAQGFTAGNRFSGPIVISGNVTIPGGVPQFNLVDCEPIELNVRSLPQDGELPGFTGAIGHLSLDPPRLTPNQVQAGDTVKLSVTVHGDGSVARLPAPPPPVARDWQIFSGATEPAPAQPFVVPPPGTPPESSPGVPGAAIVFTSTLIPLAENVRATPVIPFSYFDPARAVYVSLPIPAVPLTVKPSPSPADLAALARADTEPAGTEKEPVLGDLASTPGLTAGSLVPLQRRVWFPLVQCAPALAFAALWGWDRRRRYLEQHPRILLCRHARRALHRERRAMRRAVQAGDAPGFATAAVNAMRVACAPHYPAEPAALVGADVLALLPITEVPVKPSDLDEFGELMAGQALTVSPKVVTSPFGELVRRFFTVTDAGRFGGSAADAAALLPRAPEVEQLLGVLEAKLCV